MYYNTMFTLSYKKGQVTTKSCHFQIWTTVLEIVRPWFTHLFGGWDGYLKTHLLRVSHTFKQVIFLPTWVMMHNHEGNEWEACKINGIWILKWQFWISEQGKYSTIYFSFSWKRTLDVEKEAGGEGQLQYIWLLYQKTHERNYTCFRYNLILRLEASKKYL